MGQAGDGDGTRGPGTGISRRHVLKGAGAVLAALGAASLGGAGTVHADDGEEGDEERRGGSKPRLVLVHGAWADGTGWQRVIPLLEEQGYPVIATQNPLTSIADDVATTKRVIDAESQLGPVVVVGHSCGLHLAPPRGRPLHQPCRAGGELVPERSGRRAQAVITGRSLSVQERGALIWPRSA